MLYAIKHLYRLSNNIAYCFITLLSIYLSKYHILDRDYEPVIIYRNSLKNEYKTNALIISLIIARVLSMYT